MSKSNELARRHAICKQINYDLLVRTIVRLAPDIEAEIKKSGQEFLAYNEQDSDEANVFFAETVGLVVDVLVSKIKSEVPETKKHSLGSGNLSDLTIEILSRALADVPNARERVALARDQIARQYAPLREIHRNQLERDYNHAINSIKKINQKGK